ncbi:hypothetical protein HIM_07480 [Hirsutella minnesotensis 3608]|uniref:Uncharacterized protein n=1 Tax=Hirsutella minnesotensis 3608 TaxID=1043627 RepID=A0A0F7ZHR4_9HYPO|nr:hypothetical protein HIM_07480 [Hirsutella minnesotensis 3608]
MPPEAGQPAAGDEPPGQQQAQRQPDHAFYMGQPLFQVAMDRAYRVEGLQAVRRPDRSEALQSVATETVITETVGTYSGSEHFTQLPNQAGAVVREPLTVVKVFRRASHIGAIEIFSADKPQTNKTALSRHTFYDYGLIEERLRPPIQTYVGFDARLASPATMCPPKVSAKDTPDYNRDNLAGLSIRSMEKGHAVGSKIVVPAPLAVPGNLAAWKKVIVSVKKGRFQEAVDELETWEIDSDTLQRALTDVIRSLAVRATPDLVVKIKPLSPYLAIQRNDNRLPDPNKPRGRGNYPPCDRVPSGLAFLWDQLRFKGFVLHIPFMGALDFPPELNQLLIDFALRHPHDIFHPEMMRLGVLLWYRIKKDASHWHEGWTDDDSKIEVPHLALFIIYTGIYFSWHEERQALSYMHIARFIIAAYNSDVAFSAKMSVRAEILDESRVIGLIEQTQSRWEGITLFDSQIIIPASWPGSAMIYPNGAGVQQPTATVIALCGLGNIKQYGLPTYNTASGTPEEQLFMEVAIPKVLVGVLCTGPGTELKPEDITDDVWRASKPGPIFLYRRYRCLGPIWEPHFSPPDPGTPPGRAITPAPKGDWRLSPAIEPRRCDGTRHEQGRVRLG